MSSIDRRTLMASSSALVLLGRGAALAQPAGAAAPNTDWLHYANDLSSTRYSPLDQINADNFNTLELAWRFSTNALGPRPDADYQSTPLIAKGRIYVTAGFRRDVVCLDGATGEQLWMHRYDEGERVGSRGGPGLGVGYWTDGTNERVIYVTRSYLMFSLDARTGIPDPGFGTGGMVDLRLNDDQTIDPEKGVIGLHAPPLVVRDVIVVGAAPTAFAKGFVRGFDIRTGRRKWIFHTVPMKGEFGYDTWLKPGQAEATGNTGAWCPMSADEALGLIYVGVELPPTDMIGVSRQGPGLFGETLVALDIETGERKWHYQMIHHGLWDRDVSCAGILCDIRVHGKTIKAIAQPSKQGFVYVLDRTDGKPVWPIPEKPVPKGNVPGEWYSPTQPMPTKPPPFEKQGVTLDDLVDWTPQIKARAREIASHYTMGPLYEPPAVVTDQIFGTLCLPGLQGRRQLAGRILRSGNQHPLHLLQEPVRIDRCLCRAGRQRQPARRPAGARQRRRQWRRLWRIGQSHRRQWRAARSRHEGRPRRSHHAGHDLDRGHPADEAALWPRHRHRPQPGHHRLAGRAWRNPDHIKNHRLLKGVTIPRTGQSGILGTLTTKTLVILAIAGCSPMPAAARVPGCALTTRRPARRRARCSWTRCRPARR